MASWGKDITAKQASDLTGAKIYAKGEETSFGFKNMLDPYDQVQLIDDSITTPYGSVEAGIGPGRGGGGAGSVTGSDPYT